MNVMAIVNIVIWSYVLIVGGVLFVRWIVIKIKTRRAIKKSLKVTEKSKPAEEIDEVWED